MSAPPEALFDTAELTRWQRGILSTISSANYIDQLSRLERRSSTESWRARLVERERTYLSRGQIFTLRWKDFGQPLPDWFDVTMQGFADLITLSPNWDTYGARTIESAIINSAMRLLDVLLSPTSPAPSIVPLSSGGLQIEWHRRDQDLEIVFEPRQAPEFFYKNTLTGVEEDGLISSRLSFVAQVIRALT